MQGVHVPRGKFGIILETIHNGVDITERVSVKMVAKNCNGQVVRRLFKPIEDAYLEHEENSNTTTKIFVLSKDKIERVSWSQMEIVVVIDRRPKCHIKGISGEKFATTVCSAPTMAYLDRAVTFRLVLADLKFNSSMLL